MKKSTELFWVDVWRDLFLSMPPEKMQHPANNLIIVTIQKRRNVYSNYPIPDGSFEKVINDFYERLTIYHEVWQVNKTQKYVAVFPLSEYEWLMEQMCMIAEAHDLWPYRISLLFSVNDVEVALNYLGGSKPIMDAKPFAPRTIAPKVLRLLAKVPKTHPTLKVFRNKKSFI
jgi:hypothetical protein